MILHTLGAVIIDARCKIIIILTTLISLMPVLTIMHF